ncbi:phosphotransferase [Brevibacillus choshinensis]|uniref:Phosphotransferase n=1 Tax=Brevibacillus choshinensis TaxID=54911 RepID=A0ABR5NE58_BRECH|nr:AAA family ATPase [Brevibacillus choshinensis]KQL49836.1 phosphotransferase [Brevibacillus choshinensis]
MQTLEQRGIYLITGIMASGKSTVAQLLAEKFEKSVHLRGDVFRRMIVSWREETLPDATDEAIRQLRLRYKLAAAAADTYFNAGFTVVLQDVMLGAMLQETVDLIQNTPLHVIVLCPSQEAVETREAARAKKGYGLWDVSELDRQLREETPRIGMWIDTTELSAEETVEQIWLRARGEARVKE